MLRPLVLLAALVMPLALAPVAGHAELAEGTYYLVPERSLAQFSVASPVGKMTARMGVSDGELVVDEAGRLVSGFAVLDATAVEGGGALAKSAVSGESGFDVAQYPTVRFAVTGGAQSGDELVIEGDLTVKGVTRPVRFAGKMTKTRPRHFAARLASRIQRTEFGISVGRPLYSQQADVHLRLVARRERTR